MSDDRWLDVADSILNGHDVGWESLPARGTPEDPVSADEMRLIADVAQAHRLPHAGIGRWGELELLERVGHGTFGDVFRARDAALDREVALKLIDHAAGTFAEEGKLLARVRHPNVVVVHGAAVHDGRYGIWMEFVRGRTLADVLRDEGPLPWADVVRIGIDVCSAVGAVHAAGLVHRDVKPQNVMREDSGRIVLMDFGTGRLATDSSMRLAGTPLYLAPEVLAGGDPDVLADLYSIGVLLFHLLSGRYPVEGRTLAEILDAHARGVRTRLSDQHIDCPRSLAAAIDRAIASTPAARFASAEAFAASLRTVLRPRARVKRWVGAAAALTAAVGLGALFWSANGRPTFHAHDFLLVGAFDNRTGDASLDGAVEAAITRELSMSSFVNVAPPQRVDDALRLMTRPLETALAPAAAREVCLRDGGIREYVTGRLDRLGSRYRLSAALHDTSNERLIDSMTEDASSIEALLTAARRLSDRIRADLGESRITIRDTTASVEKLPAPALQALRLYSESLELGGREEWPEALDLARRAVVADPQFPLAHSWEGWCLKRTNAAPDAVVAEGKRGLDLADRAANWERLWVEASYDNFTGDGDAELAALVALVQLRPDQYWALNNLSNRLRNLGRDADAGPYKILRADLRPFDGSSVDAAAVAFIRAGDRVRALKYAERARELSRAIGWFAGAAQAWVLVPAEDAWGRGDFKGVASMLDQTRNEFAGRPPAEREGIARQLVIYNLVLGRTTAANLATDLFADANLRHVHRAVIAFHHGDRQGFQREMALVTGTATTLDSRDVYRLEAGRFNEVRNNLLHPPQGASEQGSSFVDQARIALASGHTAEAISTLELARPFPETVQEIVRFSVLADLYLQQGDRDHAMAILAESMHARESPDLVFWWMRNELRLAELYHDVGRDKDAAPLEAELDKLLSVADPDFPILVNLRALQAKTRVGPGR